MTEAESAVTDLRVAITGRVPLGSRREGSGTYRVVAFWAPDGALAAARYMIWRLKPGRGIDSIWHPFTRRRDLAGGVTWQAA